MASQKDLARALELLGVERLIFAIHDLSFPSRGDDDIGTGSPYSGGGLDLLKFAHELGFNAIQFGPQGLTTFANPSPYDGTIFSRNDLLISLRELTQGTWHHLLPAESVDALVAGKPSAENAKNRTEYRYAWNAQHQALRQAFENFKARAQELGNLTRELKEWCTAQESKAGNWLKRDGLFQVLCMEHESDDWRNWNVIDRTLFSEDADTKAARLARISELETKNTDELEFFNFCQFVVHKQHANLRKTLSNLGIRTYGDMHIGYSLRDNWSRDHLLLQNYSMGAPPSRTNPDGQPWGYPVLNPELYFDINEGTAETSVGPALSFFESRIDKMLEDFDGIRVDHPHGIVCPWVYKSGTDDNLKAVQSGARMFCSPDLEDHPQLAQYAIVRPEQINRDTKRYADDWVSQLDDKQVSAFAVLMDRIVSLHSDTDVFCEVLSTCPYPLKQVLNRFNLGRFRITQKADLENKADVYRSENAEDDDIIMVGNHDTKPLWLLVDKWFETGHSSKWADYLAARLEPDEAKRQDFARELITNKSKFCHAMFADLFVSKAKNVYIFFADLLGTKGVFNDPGTINDTNWGLRVPSDFASDYAANVKTGSALSIDHALALALHARYPKPDKEVRALIDRLST